MAADHKRYVVGPPVKRCFCISAVAGRCHFLRDTIRGECQPAFTANSFYRWDFLSGNRIYSLGQVLIRRFAFNASGGFRGAFNERED